MSSSTGELGRKELGDFLRTRRRKADPEKSGIKISGSSTGRRRIQGLRREEVAQLSGVSLTWYTWLEQGRNINVSRQVLGGIARALALDAAERRHLFRLAGEIPQDTSLADRNLTPGPEVQAFIDLLDPNPAYVITRCFDVVAWNRAEVALMGGFDHLPEHQHNVLWLMFNDPRARELLPDWEREARWLVGLLRAESAHELGSPRFIEVVSGLRKSSPLFSEWWTSHDVQEFASSVRRFNHPTAGELTLNYVKLVLEGGDGLSIVSHFAAPGSAAEKQLSALVAAAPTARAVP